MDRIYAAVTSFIMFLLVVSMLGAAYVQAQAVSGLAVGNRFTYSNTYTWTSSIPGDIVPSPWMGQNNSMVQVTVQNVTGSTVTLLEVWTFTNGTQWPTVELDEVNGGSSGILAYAGNLTAGQPLYPAATDMPAINDSVYRSYEGNVRLTNHIEVNNTGMTGMEYSYMNLYFDQQTGICVEYYLTSVYTDAPNQVLTQHLELTNSNVWQVSATTTSGPTQTASPSQTGAANPTPTPSGSASSDQGFPTDLIIIIAVVVVVIVVAAFFLLPKGKPKPKSKQPESAEPQEPTAPEEAPKKTPGQTPQENPEEDSYTI